MLAAEPVVPAPPTSIVPSHARISQASDGRVLALDAGDSAVGRARSRPWRPDWAWTSTACQVEGYTSRELADALGLTFASFAPGSEVSDGDPSWDLVANTLIAQDGLDIADRYGLFGGWSRDDWARVLSQWSDVSAALDAHVVPPGFAPDWADAELELAFARSHGVRYIQGMNLLWGSNGVLPAIDNGGFSADDLRKILEFAVRVRVIKYAGRIQEWIGVSEASGDLLYDTPEQRFWDDQLGTGIIDQVFTWAHEADPGARLAFCDDRILDQASAQVFQAVGDKFMGFLEHFKAAGVPVDKAVIEDNLWIYAPPSKDSMVATLQQIQSPASPALTGGFSRACAEPRRWPGRAGRSGPCAPSRRAGAAPRAAARRRGRPPARTWIRTLPGPPSSARASRGASGARTRRCARAGSVRRG